MTEEDNLQIAAMRYIRLQYSDAISFHVRNEGIRGSRAQQMAYGSKSKKMGVLSGVSDIIILEPKGIYHGLLIELKSKKGRIQPSQTLFLDRAKAKNYMTAICRTFDEVQECVDEYMYQRCEHYFSTFYDNTGFVNYRDCKFCGAKKSN